MYILSDFNKVLVEILENIFYTDPVRCKQTVSLWGLGPQGAARKGGKRKPAGTEGKDGNWLLYVSCHFIKMSAVRPAKTTFPAHAHSAGSGISQAE